jgi:hypothetical protein
LVWRKQAKTSLWTIIFSKLNVPEMLSLREKEVVADSEER